LRPSPKPIGRIEVPPEGIDLEESLQRYERGLLEAALEQSGGVKTEAARLLGISFRSFRYRLQKLGLDDDESNADES
jgi:two-component system response regulator PilR (NtrC family)